MDDSAQVPPSSIPNDEPSSPLTPPLSPNPKIELPDVPVMPGEPRIDDKKEIPIVEVPDQPAKTPPIAPSAVPIPEPEIPQTPVVPPVIPEIPEKKVEELPSEPPETTSDEPFLVAPRPMPQTPDSIVQETGIEETPQQTVPEMPGKKNKTVLVGGLVVLVLAGTFFAYFALQKGPVKLKSGAEQPYPPTITPTITITPIPTLPLCSVQKTYSGADVCSQGGTASISMVACVPVGCPSTTVSYHEVKKTCTGDQWAGCGGACGDSGSNKTATVPAGGCVTVSLSCSSPKCGSCQVDIDDYGERKWQHSGCGGTPSASATPTPTPAVSPPASCSGLTVVVDGDKDLTKLVPGDQISFTVSFSGLVEDVVVDLRKDGQSVRQFQANGSKNNSWQTATYTINSTGSYQVMAFVKVNGVWK